VTHYEFCADQFPVISYFKSSIRLRLRLRSYKEIIKIDEKDVNNAQWMSHRTLEALKVLESADLLYINNIK